jgi:hypothetical protein
MSKIPQSIHWKELNEYKAKLTLTEKQHEIIKGTILGDNHIELVGKTKSRILFEQKNKDYLFHLYENFKDWTKTGQRLDKDWTKTGQRLDKDWTKTGQRRSLKNETNND